MKKIIPLIIIALSITIVFAEQLLEKADSVTSKSAREGLFLNEMMYEDTYKQKAKLNIDEGYKIHYLDDGKFTDDNTSHKMEDYELTVEHVDYYFPVVHGDKEVGYIVTRQENGADPYVYHTGETNNGFHSAVDLLASLGVETYKLYNFFDLAFCDVDYFLLFTVDDTEYIFPFNAASRPEDRIYSIKDITQLPTVEDVIQAKKDTLEEIDELVKEFQKTHDEGDIMFGFPRTIQKFTEH